MPLITTLAGASARGYGGLVTFGGGTSYESIATATVSSDTGSVTLSSIPSTYTHLQLRCFWGQTSATSTLKIQFNSDTAANYSWHSLYGSGASAAAGSSSSASNMVVTDFGPGGLTTSPGSAIVDILNYKDTNKYKTLRSLAGYDGNGSGYIGIYSGSWRSTSAITSITLTMTSIKSGSVFALYGIK
jgi:hypothetical protein